MLDLKSVCSPYTLINLSNLNRRLNPIWTVLWTLELVSYIVEHIPVFHVKELVHRCLVSMPILYRIGNLLEVLNRRL